VTDTGAPEKATETAAAAKADAVEIDSDVEFIAVPTFSVTHEMKEELKPESGDLIRAEDLEDNERLPKENDPWPELSPPGNVSPQVRQDTEKAAAAAMMAGDFNMAIAMYTEAMTKNGSNPGMLATRAALLLKLKRPCAAIRDCTAAMKINNQMVKAYRIRGMGHRRLGNWKKAYRDLDEAQNLKYDPETVEMHGLVARKCGIGPAKSASSRASPRKRSAARDETSPKPPPVATFVDFDFPDPPSKKVVEAQLPDLNKGQAVVLVGLQKAPHLNGRRGVVEREDPRPASKGRWEVEVRMDGGALEIKSIKRDNISTLNKADREACKAWAKAEKAHKDSREKREQQEEASKYKAVVEAKIDKLELQDRARDLLRLLGPEQALSVLDRADGPGVTNINEFVVMQAKLLLGHDSDSDDEAKEPAAKKAKNKEE